MLSASLANNDDVYIIFSGLLLARNFHLHTFKIPIIISRLVYISGILASHELNSRLQWVFFTMKVTSVA